MEYKLRRHQREGRRGKYPPRVLYNEQDVTMALELFRVVPYDQPVQVHDSLTATFHDAGHVLGSAMVQCEVRESGKVSRILFSGDIGQCNKPIIRDPSLPEEADYVVMESTYGDRDHNHAGDVETQLEVVVNETVERGGNVVIPTFAVERAQELMYYISRLVHARRIPKLKVFLDSPMAVDVTEIYRGLGDFFDADTLAMMADNRPPLRFPGLTLCRSVKESKAINDYRKPCIIMASSGMCTAGRIKHHLRQNIGNPASTVLFVGYQGQGSLGRQIVEKNPVVRIHGADHKVRAQIRQIYGFSGHADRTGLLRWIGNLKHAPRQIFLTHGEENAAQRLADEIRTRWSWPVTIPNYGDAIELG